MNKLAMLIVILGNTFVGFGQISITKDQFPFSRVLEWENHGVLIFAEDPKKQTNEQEVFFVNQKGEEQWRKSIYPKTNDPKLVIASNSDYIYLIDDISPHRNKIRYNQINRSGSIVSTKFDLLQVIRSYGYRTPNELVMQNVINTKKSLVFHFQLEVKTENIIENFIIMITHHNNRVYHAKGPVTRPELIEEQRQGALIFAGNHENTICFGRYSNNGNDHRVNFIPYDEKAKKQNPYSFSLPDVDPMMSSLHSANWDGMRFTRIAEDRETEARGWPVYERGNYYYAAIDEKDRCFKVFGANQEGEIVPLATCEQPAESSWRYNPTIEWTRSSDVSIVCGTIQDQKQCFVLSAEGVNQSEANQKLHSIFKNPALLEHPTEMENAFIVELNGQLYELNLEELKQRETITLKRKN